MNSNNPGCQTMTEAGRAIASPASAGTDKRLTKGLAAAFAAAALLLQTAGATSVIDTFDDVGGATNGITLTLLNTTGIGGIGFTTKYEQTGSGVPVLRTNDLIVNLTNYVSGQTSATQHWAVAAVVTSSGAARRTQTRSVPSMSGTIWFSFLASLQNGNGDVALTFNGVFNGSGVPNNNTVGVRVGLGHPSRQGAMGVGPLAISTGAADLTTINNGVNGVITTNRFAPTNGTPGLVLGKIWTDPTTFLQRIDLWYNPDVPNEASLPAADLTFIDTNSVLVPYTVTRIGYQVNRTAAPAMQNEIIDNIKVSDEATGFDIVYKSAPLPLPSLSVLPTQAVVSEAGASNIVFTIQSDRTLADPHTIYYLLSGVATNGYIPFSSPDYTNADYVDASFDPNTRFGSVTIPAGSSNAAVTLTVLNDSLPETAESVILTLQPSASEFIIAAGSATGTIIDDNDANTAVQYMFEQNLLPETWDTNIMASPMNTAGVGTSFSTVYNNTGFNPVDFPSPLTSLAVPGTATGTNQDDSIARGNFESFQIAPAAGRALTVTNIQFMALYGNYLNMVPGAASATVFVRSSLDGFTSDIASFDLPVAESQFPNPGWSTNNVPLGPQFANQLGQVVFRLYIYDDSNVGQVGVRLDNLFIGATTTPLPPGAQQVIINGTSTEAAEPSTPGTVTIARLGDTNNPLTVYYSTSGTASNGVDYVMLPGTATIAAGESNVVVTVTPIDDDFPEATETAIITLTTNAAYGVIQPSSATVNIADDGDLGGLIAYFFNENNNNAPTLQTGALPSIKLTNQVAALGADVGPGLGTFGMNGSAPGVGHGFGNSLSFSAPSTLFINDSYVTTNAEGALANGDYLSISVGPVPGFALSLTNINAQLKMTPTAGQTNYLFLRSSMDNFASDIASIVLPAVAASGDPWTFWSVPLTPTNYPGGTEFRIYVYNTRISGSDITRIDDLTFRGALSSAPVGVKTVSAINPVNAGEPGNPGSFTLIRSGDASAPLTVNYTVSGTAVAGKDYAPLSGTATFGAGETNIVVPIIPMNDPIAEPTETVIVRISPSANYYPGLPLFTSVGIVDDGDLVPYITKLTLGDGAVTLNFNGPTSDAAAAYVLQSASTVDGPYNDDPFAIITGSLGSYQAVTGTNSDSQYYRIKR